MFKKKGIFCEINEIIHFQFKEYFVGTEMVPIAADHDPLRDICFHLLHQKIRKKIKM